MLCLQKSKKLQSTRPSKKLQSTRPSGMNGLDSHEMQTVEAKKIESHLKNSRGLQVGLIKFALLDSNGKKIAVYYKLLLCSKNKIINIHDK